MNVSACVLTRFSCVQLFATLWTPRLLCPWDLPGKNTGVGCHAFLQGIFPTQGSNPRLLQQLFCRWILYCWATREDISLGNDFLDMISKVQVSKAKIKWNYSKLKNFCIVKQSTKWKVNPQHKGKYIQTIYCIRVSNQNIQITHATQLERDNPI